MNDLYEFDNLIFTMHCEEGNLKKVKKDLKDPNINIHFDNEAGLKAAIKAGHLEIVKYLICSPQLNEHAHVWDGKGSLLLSAAQYGHVEILEFLSQHYTDDASLPENILHNILETAATHNRINILQYYYDKDPTSVTNSKTLHAIMEKGIYYCFVPVLKWAQDNNIDYSEHHKSLLYFALVNADHNILYYLTVEAGIVYNDDIKDMLTTLEKNVINKTVYSIKDNNIIYCKNLFETLQIHNELQDNLPNNKKKNNSIKI